MEIISSTLQTLSRGFRGLCNATANQQKSATEKPRLTLVTLPLLMTMQQLTNGSRPENYRTEATVSVVCSHRWRYVPPTPSSTDWQTAQHDLQPNGCETAKKAGAVLLVSLSTK